MNRSRILTALFALTLGVSAHGAPTVYTITENVAPGAIIERNTVPTGDSTGVRLHFNPSMNDFGDITGRIETPYDGDPRYLYYPAIWKGGQLQPIALPSCESTVTICAAAASHINNYGIASGAANVPKYPSPWGATPLAPYYQHEVLIVNGRASAIKGNGSEFGWTTDINDNGNIVGASRSTEYVTHSGDYYTHGLVWLSDNLTYEIGGFRQPSIANAINNATQVTGTMDFDRNGKWRAFIWEPGVVVDLGTLGGDYSEGWDINDATSPQVVGASLTSGNVLHAFLWQSGSMRDLTTLGGKSSAARAINNFGAIVGYAETATGLQHGFVWMDGVMYDLNDFLPAGSAWTVIDAYAINKHGEILVRAQKQSAESYIVLSPPNTVHDPRPSVTNIPAGVALQSSTLIGGADIDGAYVVASDVAGNVFTGGSFRGIVDFDSGPNVDSKTSPATYSGSSTYASKLFVTKTTATGEYLWTVTIGGASGYSNLNIAAMVTDSVGNLYVMGNFSEATAIKFESRDGSSKWIGYEMNSYSTKSFIAQYSPDGMLVWHKLIMAPTGSNFHGLALDSLGNVNMAGIFDAYDMLGFNYDYLSLYVLSGTGNQNIQSSTPAVHGIAGCNGTALRFSPLGDYLGATLIAPAAANDGCVYQMDIANASDGGIFLAGTFSGRIDLNPLDGTDIRSNTPGYDQNFVTKIDSNGNYAWSRTRVRESYSDQSGIAADNVGGMYWFAANVYDRSKLTRLDAAGNTLWERRVKGDSFTVSPSGRLNLYCDTRGNVYIPGSFGSARNFDTTTMIDYKAPYDTWSGFLTKWNASGEYGWTMVTPSLTSAVMVDGAGRLISVGTTYVSLDYDPSDSVPAMPLRGMSDGYRMVFQTSR